MQIECATRGIFFPLVFLSAFIYENSVMQIQRLLKDLFFIVWNRRKTLTLSVLAVNMLNGIVCPTKSPGNSK